MSHPSLNVTVKVLVEDTEDTDHVTELFVRLSGSLKLSQPRVHFCVVATEVPTDKSNANERVEFGAKSNTKVSGPS